MSRSSLFLKSRNALLLGALLVAVAPPVLAQRGAEKAAEARAAREAEKQKNAPAATAAAAQYPNATRAEPGGKASAKLGPQLKKIFDAYEAEDAVTLTGLADAMIGNASANAYERALAARLAGAGLLASDPPRAKGYLQKAIEFNGLSNNEHFESMLLLAQLQLQDDQFAESLATVDRYLAETRSQKPEDLVVRGNALYRLERYPEAAAVLKQAVTTAPEPRGDWLQLLMGAYVEMEQPGEAAAIAEGLAAKNPNDQRLQVNLASIYMQAEQNDKAIAVLEKLRSSGRLTEDRDYRNLVALYMGTEGREKDSIAVINDGLAKGVLKPDYQTYVALAQAYYFSEQPLPAIEAYKKAAPLAPNGETYLNLARAQWQEGDIAGAKQSAREALAKGLQRPDDAKKIIALPGN